MGSSWRVKAAVSAAVVALLVLGVLGASIHDGKSQSSPAAAPGGRQQVRVAKGWKMLSDATDGVVIDVPAGWRTPILTAGTYADTMKSFAADNPEFASIIGQRASNSSSPIGLFAVDPVSHATLVIQSAPTTAAGDPTVLPSVVRDRYTVLGIALVATDAVRLPLGHAVRASLRFISAGKELVARQYFVIDGSRLITLTIQRPAASEPATTDDRIAQSADRTA